MKGFQLGEWAYELSSSKDNRFSLLALTLREKIGLIQTEPVSTGKKHGIER